MPGSDKSYRSELAEAAEAMFRRNIVGRHERCVALWATCAERWQNVGFVCRRRCRAKSPGYYPKAD